MTQRAVLIGCNYGGTSNALQGCINDVFRVRDLLKTVYQFPENNISILTDNKSRDDHLYPSKLNVLQAMRSLISQTHSGDISVIHYSGHGTTQSSSSSTSITYPGTDDAIVPADVLNQGYFNQSALILDDELWEVISKVPSGATLFVILDACHTGSALDLPYNMRLDSSNPSRYILDRVERRPETSGTVVLLSGCKDDQTSLDASDNSGRPAGALTYCFCDYILRNPGASITYADLLQHVRRSIQDKFRGVPNLQEPQLDFGRMIDAAKQFTLGSGGFNQKAVDHLLANQLPPGAKHREDTPAPAPAQPPVPAPAPPTPVPVLPTPVPAPIRHPIHPSQIYHPGSAPSFYNSLLSFYSPTQNVKSHISDLIHRTSHPFQRK